MKKRNLRLFLQVKLVFSILLYDIAFSENVKCVRPDEFEFEQELSHSHAKAGMKIVASSIAATGLEKTIFYPLDTIIVLKQQQSKSLGKIASDLLTEGGVPSFFRGYKSQMISTIPVGVVLFATNDIFNQYFKKTAHKEVITSIATAAVFTAVYNPFDLYRTWYITHNESYTPKKIFDYYKGVTPQLTKSFLYSFLAISGTRYIANRDDIFSTHLDSSFKHLLSGTVMGGLAQIFMSPVDLVKTHVMADKLNRGTLFHIKQALKDQYLWRGTLARSLRYGPGAGVIMGTMEWIKGRSSTSST